MGFPAFSGDRCVDSYSSRKKKSTELLLSFIVEDIAPLFQDNFSILFVDSLIKY